MRKTMTKRCSIVGAWSLMIFTKNWVHNNSICIYLDFECYYTIINSFKRGVIMSIEQDECYIKETFKLARKGLGYVSPNPLIGALLVKDNQIIAQGFHRCYGAAHAELDAINNCRQSIEGATLYCNLEPCCHTNKQTPPCAQRLIQEKIARVVIAHKDSNPLVAGKGLELLRNAGIEVTQGVLEDEGKELNEVFINYMTQQRPFVHLKWAQTLDGKIATITGHSKWISNDLALKRVHHLRQKYDAILVGQKTLVKDNPRLTARIEHQIKVPWRIVLASLQVLDLDLNIMQCPEKTIVVTTKQDQVIYAHKAQQLQDQGMHILAVEGNDRGYVNILELLDTLKQFSITSVLVEGGSEVLTSFYQQRLWDRLSIFIAPMFIGNGMQALGDLSITELSQAERMQQVQYEQLDEVMHCQIKRSKES